MEESQEAVNVCFEKDIESIHGSLARIEKILESFPKVFAGKWTEKVIWSVASAIGLAFMAALIGLVFARPVIAGFVYILHKFI